MIKDGLRYSRKMFTNQRLRILQLRQLMYEIELLMSSMDIRQFRFLQKHFNVHQKKSQKNFVLLRLEELCAMNCICATFVKLLQTAQFRGMQEFITTRGYVLCD